MLDLAERAGQVNAVNEISLMFSGGVDSTVTAMHLARRYDRVHLLTFANGYGHYGFSRPRRRARELSDRFPGRFVYHFESSRPLFEAMAVRTLEEDYRRYGSGFIWCLGCKLAMHAMSASYDLRHRIREHTDGSSGDTSEMVEQSRLSLSMIARFYGDHGIRFAPTDYDVPRDEKRAFLKLSGFRMGLPIRDRYLGIQPSCVPGELYYLPYLLLGRPPVHPERAVARFIREKRPIMDRHVEQGAG